MTDTIETPVETERWEQRGGTGVDCEPYCSAVFEDETIDIIVGVRLSVSAAGVIPERLQAEFWHRFWEGAVEGTSTAFCDALVGAFSKPEQWDDGGRGIPWFEYDDYMRAADAMLQVRFEECGGREIETPRASVPDEVLDSRFDEMQRRHAG